LLDSHDNLRAALKPIVDQVAVWLGVDDADPRVTWEYGQRRIKRRHQPSVVVEVEVD
jgi:hypothetical protein